MAARSRQVEAWLNDLSLDQRQQAEWLTSLIHAAVEAAAEAIKWGRLTFTVHDDWHHWLCAIAVTKQGTKLVFHKGALLDDPDGLLEGEARYIRHIPHEQVAAHPEAAVVLIQEAVARQTDVLEDGR